MSERKIIRIEIKEAKPCPFCGSPPEFVDFGCRIACQPQRVSWAVGCTNKECVSVLRAGERPAIVNKWNTRVETQDSSLCLERCRLALGNIAEEIRRANELLPSGHKIELRTFYDAIDDIVTTTNGK